MRLYGDAQIKYGGIELEADVITIDYNLSTIHAKGTLDSTGRRKGFPVFTNENEQYEAVEMTYNLKTKKAKIFEVVTKQGEAILHSNEVFKTTDNKILARKSAYTTCDLPDPHYRIISTKSKAIPGDKVISGPFYMEFNHVPLPVGFAFGMFPSKIKATSGIIMPTYGEEARRGFFLRNGGYYFNINEFVDLTVTGDIYTKGSSALNLISKYKVRYKYDGSFNFAYTNNRQSSNIEDKNSKKDFRISWSHSPQTKGTGRFSASVNAATSTFTNNNYLGVNTNPQAPRLDNTSTKMNSNISYSKSFPAAGITLGLNMRHSQDLITRRIDLPIPDLSLNVNNIYPFRKIAKGVSSLENINIRLTTAGTNQLTNSLGLQPKISSITGKEIIKNKSVVLVDSVANFNLQNLGTFFRNARKGVKHTLPLATSIKVFKYLTVSPSISLTELWYFDKLGWGLDSTRSKAIVTDTIREFNRVSNYSLSVGVNTRIYGMLFFKEGRKIQAIRHVLNPSLSYSYQPDYADEKYGYFQKLQVINSPVAVTKSFVGAEAAQLRPSDFKTVYMPRHQGYVYGASSRGRSSTMSFGLNNSVEMKVKGKEDTLSRKVSILNSLSISSGYNFLAEQYKLTPFSIGANTNILDSKVSLNVSASLDPYQYRLDSTDAETGRIYQTRIDRYVWKDELSIGRISTANFAFSTNLNPKGNEKDKGNQKQIVQSNLNDEVKNTLLQNPDAYVDFSIPWNLRLNYNVTYSKQGFLPAQVVQSLRMNGDFSLSEKWKIQYNTGYDFESKQFTQTNFSLTRDLHCWTMSFNWVPFGQFQSYNFFIGIKSSLLKDLKVNRTRSFFDLQN
jgi:LptD protein